MANNNKIPNTRKYDYTYREHETTDHDGLTYAPAAGTLRTAVRLARKYHTTILCQLAGFTKYRVERDGTWSQV